jgi:TPR repeat protein
MRPELKLEHPNYFFYKGHQYARGVGGGPPELKKAMDGFHTACELGDMRGCYELGALVITPKASPEFIAAGVKRFQAVCSEGACDAGTKVMYSAATCARYVGLACERLGMHYDQGIGVTKDRKLATTAWQRACEFG